MAMQSEFYRDTSQMENKLFGISKRQFKAILYCILIFIVVLVELFLLPTVAFYVVSFVTGGILSIYPIFLLLNKWKTRKRKTALYFLYEERVYLTGQIRRYGKDEFIQEKSVKETDTI